MKNKDAQVRRMRRRRRNNITGTSRPVWLGPVSGGAISMGVLQAPYPAHLLIASETGKGGWLQPAEARPKPMDLSHLIAREVVETDATDSGDEATILAALAQQQGALTAPEESQFASAWKRGWPRAVEHAEADHQEHGGWPGTAAAPAAEPEVPVGWPAASTPAVLAEPPLHEESWLASHGRDERAGALIVAREALPAPGEPEPFAKGAPPLTDGLADGGAGVRWAEGAAVADVVMDAEVAEADLVAATDVAGADVVADADISEADLIAGADVAGAAVGADAELARAPLAEDSWAEEIADGTTDQAMADLALPLVDFDDVVPAEERLVDSASHVFNMAPTEGSPDIAPDVELLLDISRTGAEANSLPEDPVNDEAARLAGADASAGFANDEGTTNTSGADEDAANAVGVDERALSGEDAVDATRLDGSGDQAPAQEPAAMTITGAPDALAENRPAVVADQPAGIEGEQMGLLNQPMAFADQPSASGKAASVGEVQPLHVAEAALVGEAPLQTDVAAPVGEAPLQTDVTAPVQEAQSLGVDESTPVQEAQSLAVEPADTDPISDEGDSPSIDEGALTDEAPASPGGSFPFPFGLALPLLLGWGARQPQPQAPPLLAVARRRASGRPTRAGARIIE